MGLMLTTIEKAVGSSTVDARLGNYNGSKDEKSQSIESFTVDLDNSTIVTFDEEKTKYNDENASNFDPLKVFTKQLLIELIKINEFYLSKELVVFQDYDNLVRDLESNHINIDELFKTAQAYQHEFGPIEHSSRRTCFKSCILKLR